MNIYTAIWFLIQLLINVGLWLQIWLLRRDTDQEIDIIGTYVDKWCVKKTPKEADEQKETL